MLHSLVVLVTCYLQKRFDLHFETHSSNQPRFIISAVGRVGRRMRARRREARGEEPAVRRALDHRAGGGGAPEVAGDVAPDAALRTGARSGQSEGVLTLVVAEASAAAAEVVLGGRGRRGRVVDGSVGGGRGGVAGGVGAVVQIWKEGEENNYRQKNLLQACYLL